MNDQSMLTKVKEYFSPGASVPKARQKAWERLHRKKKAPLSTSPDDFEEHLNDILERFTTVSAGHIGSFHDNEQR